MSDPVCVRDSPREGTVPNSALKIICYNCIFYLILKDSRLEFND
jgi:hypothetical protein